MQSAPEYYKHSDDKKIPGYMCENCQNPVYAYDAIQQAIGDRYITPTKLQ